MALVLGACSTGADPTDAPVAIERLERTLLAQLGSGAEAWLLCGRFELTRGEFLSEADPRERECPMTMISWPECATWAEQRGFRGPTAAEWRALAGAPVENANTAALARNTLELGLGRALPVGVFERGRSPMGGYDFYGNVWEMVDPGEAGRLQALGGSFAAREVGADAREALVLELGDRAEDVGARYVAGAVNYFREQVLPAWQDSPSTAERALRRAVANWKADARARFAVLLRTEGFPAELCAVLER